jgi:hypothetical protein
MGDSVKCCSQCKTEKSVVDFGTDRSKKDGRCSACKLCVRRKAAEWAANNPERKKANDAKLHKVRYATNPEKERQRRKDWRENNPEYFRTYVDNNRGAHNARVARRDALKLKATPVWADQKAISGLYLTARQLTESARVEYEVDHIVPLRSRLVCGLHCDANLRIITKTENGAKRNLHWPDMP